MAGYLLDVNVLIALFWQNSEHHTKVYPWFQARAKHQWFTCSITQLGFIRVVSSPGVRGAVEPRRAIQLLQVNLSSRHHRFLADEQPPIHHLARFAPRLQGYRQVTDAYLLGIAIHHKVILATLDKAFPQLAAPAFAPFIELIE